MVVFGLILLLVALAIVIYMWLATAGMDPIAITYGFLNVEITPIWLFIVGGITLAAATCGLWLLAVGTRSKARRAKEVRQLRRQATDSDRRTERERDAAQLGKGSTSGSGTPRQGTGSGAAGQGSGSSGSGEGPILPRPGGERRPGSTTGTS